MTTTDPVKPFYDTKLAELRRLVNDGHAKAVRVIRGVAHNGQGTAARNEGLALQDQAIVSLRGMGSTAISLRDRDNASVRFSQKRAALRAEVEALVGVARAASPRCSRRFAMAETRKGRPRSGSLYWTRSGLARDRIETKVT